MSQKDIDIYDKYYRVYAGINLDNIENNIACLKRAAGDNVKFMAVIKADGYGHGAVPVALNCQRNVDIFAVATIDEALNLVCHNVEKPILVLGYTHVVRYEEMVENDIRATIFKEEDAVMLNEKAGELGKKAYIHIKIDTGMGRIGFKPDETGLSAVEKICSLSNIEAEGIFTHFASSDSSDKEYTKRQLDIFNGFVCELGRRGIHIPMRHAANSAAIIDMPETALDCVRAGIAMYGLKPSDEVNTEMYDSGMIKPAMEVKSHIIYIKEINAGESVSYGMTFVADKKMKIATVPVGYGDGYPRGLSNTGYVLINKNRAAITGRICMDQFMVDVTDIDDVKEGDVVTLIGGDAGIDMLSAGAGLFNYEFICDIGKRVPRIYYKDGRIVGNRDYYID